jgi:long-chain acyl-CoA synthetase
MTLDYADAAAQVTAPGQRFETMPIDVDGVTYTAFKNAPPSLRELVLTLRARSGDADDVFIVYEDERWTFSDLMGRIDAFGAALVSRYSISKGDRVAIAFRNYPEWVAAFAAIVAVGAVAVPLNAWWTEDEIAYALEDCGARVLVADRERIERALPSARKLGCAVIGVRTGETIAGVDDWDDVISVAGDATLPDIVVAAADNATILYTSGTTGFPKGAVSTHRAVVQALLGFACRTAIERLRNPETPQPHGRSAFILIVPLFHVTGLVPVMLGCLTSGSKLVVMYKWDPDRALELIEREQVTNFVGVPTQSWDLLQSPRFADFDTSSLVSVGGGGAPAPPELVKKVAGSFKRAQPGIGYGMTETNAYGPQNSGADYVSHPTSTGRTTPILQVAVQDEDGTILPSGERGEIVFSGPNLISGYWNKPEATAETIVNGWLRTGDVGRIDAEGFVYVEDRLKDMVLRGGENVYCAEVEAAIYECPAVHEAAVFGVPHERLGEEVACAVYLRPGETLTTEELQAFVRERLAEFKVPTIVQFVDAPLPRNAAGKMLKRDLRDTVAK